MNHNTEESIGNINVNTCGLRPTQRPDRAADSGLEKIFKLCDASEQGRGSYGRIDKNRELIVELLPANARARLVKSGSRDLTGPLYRWSVSLLGNMHLGEYQGAVNSVVNG